MQEKEITVVTDESGDWEGIYVNGKLKVENHLLNIYEVLDAIGIKYNHIEIDMEKVNNNLPANLKTVVNKIGN